ncbi:hypothetical protein TrVE_jg2060 [Triparma verrucosa]|uniref:Uncharacterized protein n=1 Tax=Triparma verrucosa TaxID=1606542 RepID=A0A9W7BTX3_9STRA|nr:hypothetical protein TrVE_jg2060 [Triparma verrucosa]
MAQSTLIFSLPELEIIVERFLVQGKLVPEEDRTHAASVLSAFLNFAASDDKEKEEVGEDDEKKQVAALEEGRRILPQRKSVPKIVHSRKNSFEAKR